MTQQHDPAPIQEPGIGGPVDLAGIEGFRKVRTIAVALLAAAMFATTVANAFVGLDWPEAPPFNGAPSVFALVMQGFIWAILMLAVDAGNRVEGCLACVGALWGVVAGTLSTLGCAALLSLGAPSLPIWIQVAACLLAGYAVILPLAVPLMIFAHRRRKRLVGAAENEEQAN